MNNIEDILKLVNAGFTAEQIIKLTENPSPTKQEASSQDVSDISTASAPNQQAEQKPIQESSPKKDPEPEKTPEPDSGKTDPEPKKENSMDPQIQQMLDDQAAQIKKLQQIISNFNFGASGNVETDPQAYLNNILSSR